MEKRKKSRRARKMRVRWKQKGLKWKKIAKKLEITEAWGECKNGRENVERKGCSGRKKKMREKTVGINEGLGE